MSPLAISTAALQSRLLEIFKNLNDKGLTIVLVTHEHDIAQFASMCWSSGTEEFGRTIRFSVEAEGQQSAEDLPTLED